MYHSLAWCYLLNCQYSECIKYTNLAIENKDPSCDLCYFIPYSYYKQNEYLKCLDYIESHLEYADDFYKPFLQAISARIQKQNVDFEKISFCIISHSCRTMYTKIFHLFKTLFWITIQKPTIKI